MIHCYCPRCDFGKVHPENDAKEFAEVHLWYCEVKAVLIDLETAQPFIA